MLFKTLPACTYHCHSYGTLTNVGDRSPSWNYWWWEDTKTSVSWGWLGLVDLFNCCFYLELTCSKSHRVSYVRYVWAEILTPGFCFLTVISWLFLISFRQTQWDPPTWESPGDDASLEHEAEMDLGTPTYDENPMKVSCLTHVQGPQQVQELGASSRSSQGARDLSTWAL